MAAHNFDLLEQIVAEMKGPPDWTFRLVDEEGAKRLVISIMTVSNYSQDQPFLISHYHPVPPAVYNKKSWQRWIFDQCIRTMHHEIGEALIFDGKRPFKPCHGPGFSPYDIHDNVTEEEKRIMQDGSVRGK